MTNVLYGAIGGCMATVPMTVAMELLHRQLPSHERYPLPPRQITMRVADAVDVKDQLDEDGRVEATFVAHFGMGTTAGAAYGLVHEMIPLPAPIAGPAFGFVVWVVNYCGILPAFGILAPPNHHPVRRTALMIAAHLVWGAALGLMMASIAKRKNPVK